MPAPDMLLAASRRLGVEPEHVAVFETRREGVRAARAGSFGFVVAVAADHREARLLREEGADLVVSDLGLMVEQELVA